MTENIYYTDSYLSAYNSKIIEQQVSHGGNWLTLDNTIFYPGGGGQLADLGFIDDIPVISVKIENGLIWHQLDGTKKFPSGSDVSLRIDWDRRYYNMQQHTGQHLLSHLLWEKGLKTVSVHLGEAYTLIEVEGAFPGKEIIRVIERDSNRFIREARPLKTFWTDRESIDSIPLRKPAGEWDKLRIVEIDGLDFSACGGTHVSNTAEIGLIKCTGVEKIRGHARLKFVIGTRAYEYLDQLHGISLELKDQLQTDPVQFNTKVEAFKNELAARKKENTFYRSQFVLFKSRQIHLDCPDEDGPVLLAPAEGDYEDWKQIAKVLANDYHRLSFIVFEGRFVLVAPESSGFNTVDFLRQAGSALGLRGGGPLGFAQGTTAKTDVQAVKHAIIKYKTNQ